MFLHYPGPLCFYLPLILCFGTLLGYTGPECHRQADNLHLAMIDLSTIDNNLIKKLGFIGKLRKNYRLAPAI